MILVDANLLLYAVDSTSRHHVAAQRWLDGVLAAPAPVGLPWMSLLAFLRISTNARIVRTPLQPDEAAEIVSAWLDFPCAVAVSPGERHWEILSKLVVDNQARADLMPDAHLAALAIENGAILQTTDRDFARFDGLRFENPIAG